MSRFFLYTTDKTIIFIIYEDNNVIPLPRLHLLSCGFVFFPNPLFLKEEASPLSQIENL